MKDFVRNMVGYHTDILQAMKSTKPINYVVGVKGLYEICKNEIGTFIIKAQDVRGGTDVKEGFLTSIPEEPYIEYQGQKYLIGKDGLYKVGNGKFGLFARRVEKFNNSLNVREGFKMNLPKIPYSIYRTIINFFKEIEKKYSAEVMVEIWWDKTKKEYFVHCPEQTITEMSVDYKKSKELSLNNNYILVMDIHSHNLMPAFFSTIDDKDEKETRFYGVIGALHRSKPEYEFRMGVRGQFKTVELFELFDKNITSIKKDTFPKEWLDQIKISKISLSSFNRGYNYDNYSPHNYYFYRQQRREMAGDILNRIIERNTSNGRSVIAQKVIDALSTMSTREEEYFFCYLIQNKFYVTSMCLESMGYFIYPNHKNTNDFYSPQLVLDTYGQKVLKDVLSLNRIDYKHLLQDLINRGYKERMFSAFYNGGYVVK